MSSLLLALMPLIAGGEVRAREPADARGLPSRLADTGLYAADGSLAADVVPFSPQYPLWSDGAAKRRWIALPAGTSIDATNPDAWDFPRGTKLWKEFSHGRVIETRFITRGADGAWRFGSYVWNADRSDATLAPAAGIRELPAPDAPRAVYSIPAEDDCRACHEGAAVPVLGFSALQLSPDRDPLAPHADATATANLRTLSERGMIKGLPPALLAKPPRIDAANPVERAALGYLHGNCGNCHNDSGPLSVLEMNLAQRVSAPNGVLSSIVGVESSFRPNGARESLARVTAGHDATSVIALRMASRDPMQQMPPLGTSTIDADALRLVARWIDSLPPNKYRQE